MYGLSSFACSLGEDLHNVLLLEVPFAQSMVYGTPSSNTGSDNVLFTRFFSSEDSAVTGDHLSRKKFRKNSTHFESLK